MASTLNTGAYAVFYGSYPLTATMIDLVRSGQVPTTSNSTSFTWTRLYTSYDKSASIAVAGNTVDLMTQEEGIKNVVITSPDKLTINSGIADMSIAAYKKFLQVNPITSTSSNSGTYINLNLVGTDLMNYGFPIMIVHKGYQDLSTGGFDTPVMTDPLAFIACKVALGDRKYTIPYDPKSQQVIDFTLTAINQNGTTYTNVAGYFGTLTAATSSTST